EINHAEMHNAVVQAQHEIAVRYDFKGTKASIEFQKQDNALTLLADHKGQLETVIQVLKEKMARRGVPVNALIRGKLEVQAQIMDDKVRVTGKKIDDLQAVMAHLKENGPEYPLQFVNFTCPEPGGALERSRPLLVS